MANFCHNCGTPAVAGAKFCSNCGAKLIESAAPSNVTNQGAAPSSPAVGSAVIPPIPPSVQSSPMVPPAPPAAPSTPPVIPEVQSAPMPVAPADKSAIRIHYDGNWAAMDVKIKVFVNGQEIGKYSFLKPFDADAIVDGSRVVIKAKMWFRTADLSFMIEPGKSYKVFLSYNRAMGSIKLLLGQ